MVGKRRKVMNIATTLRAGGLRYQRTIAVAPAAAGVRVRAEIDVACGRRCTTI